MAILEVPLELILGHITWIQMEMVGGLLHQQDHIVLMVRKLTMFPLRTLQEIIWMLMMVLHVFQIN